MATLLMVESWLQSTGIRLPAMIRDLGHQYVLLSRDPSVYAPTADGPHPVIRFADEVVIADVNNPVIAVEAAHTLTRRRRIDAVLTTCDLYLETAAIVAAALGLPGPEPTAIRAAMRKHLVRAAMHRAGLPGVPHAAVADWPAARKAAAEIGYPVVTKPVDLDSSTSVRRVDDESALRAAYDDVTTPERNTRNQPRHRLLLIEEVLEGPEVSVETATHAGRTTVLGITAKTVLDATTLGGTGFVEAAHLFPAPLEPATRSAVTALATSTVDALGLNHGLAHVEVKLTPSGPRIVEVNPRQGGGYIFDLVGLVTGLNPLSGLIDLALGSSPRSTGTPGATSAAVAFVLSPVDGVVRRIEGADRWDHDPRAIRWDLGRPGRVTRPDDNNARLGYVIAADRDGCRAGAWATGLVSELRLHLDHAAAVPPMAIPLGWTPMAGG